MEKDSGKIRKPNLYLKTLNIQNFATFSNQTIQFDKQFNVIVGETGSGKSLILEALELVFGGRADKKSIRKDCLFSIIEAIFASNDPRIQHYCSEIGHPFDGDEIIVKRVIHKHDNSRSYLNFQLCSLSDLQRFSRRFVDFVGQFENQKLLSSNYQMSLLDNYAGLSDNVREFQRCFHKRNELINEIKKLNQDRTSIAQREDYLQFQINTINNLNPSDSDEEFLNSEKKKLLEQRHSIETLSSVVNILSESSSDNILGSLKKIEKLISNLGHIDDQMINKITDAKSSLEDVSFYLSSILENNSDADMKLEEILNRLNEYQSLKRKFNCTTNELLEIRNKYQEEINLLATINEKIQTNQGKLEEVNVSSLKIAHEMHKKREEASHNLSKKLTNIVQRLNMQGAKIILQINESPELTNTGISQISLLAETNPGDGLHKVSETASGGELSRILLAFRQVLSGQDTISIFLFDEIDSGIGGNTALKIGAALKDVALNSQVLAITHLAQITTFSDKIIQVEKHTYKASNNKLTTESRITEISDAEKKISLLKSMNPEAPTP